MYIEIRMKDGKTYSKLMETATGSPEKPATFEECVSKFQGCIEFSSRPLPKENADKVIEMVSRLENVGDIRELIRLLVW